MSNKWNFDAERLKRYIEWGKNALKENKLSTEKAEGVKDDLKILRRFLSGNFELPEEGIGKYTSMNRLKKIVLDKMKMEYEIIGDELITFLQDLSDESIFDVYGYFNRTDIPIEAQEELTLKNYEKNANGFYVPAKNLLSSDSETQIQVVENLSSTSWCHYSEIGKHSFLIIDPTEAVHILNHEIQHALDFDLNFLNVDNYYSELNSIFFELLFNDLLYDGRGICDYYFRLEDIQSWLCGLYEYFDAMKCFKEMDFDVPTSQFIEIIQEKFLVEEENIIPWLNEVIIGDYFEDDMTYTVSFLKAIELRNKKNILKCDSVDILRPYCERKEFRFNPDYSSFETYKSFVFETCEKQRKKSIF